MGSSWKLLVKSQSSDLRRMFEPRQRSIRKLYVNLVTCYVVRSSGRSWHCWFQPNNDTIVEDHKLDTGLNNAQILVENKVVNVLQISSTHSAMPMLNHNAIENLRPFFWFMHTPIKCDHKYVHVSHPISSHEIWSTCEAMRAVVQSGRYVVQIWMGRLGRDERKSEILNRLPSASTCMSCELARVKVDDLLNESKLQRPWKLL